MSKVLRYYIGSFMEKKVVNYDPRLKKRTYGVLHYKNYLHLLINTL